MAGPLPGAAVLRLFDPPCVGAAGRTGQSAGAGLGCGNGQLCATQVEQGYQVAGVDYDRRGIALARSHHPHIPFYRFGVQDAPRELLAQEQPFDTVVSTEVIEHLFSPHLLPAYAAGVLAPGGHLLLTTPYHGYIKNLALSLVDKWDDHHTAL